MQNQYIISTSFAVKEALEFIDNIGVPNMALFVVDENHRLVGTVTDGDIRRGLIRGLKTNDLVVEVMNVAFKFIIDGEDNFEKIEWFKQNGIRFVPVLNKDSYIIKLLDLENIRSLIPVDVVLMAGGKGERLKSLTKNIPKPMLKVGDIPIIIRNMERLANFGVTNFHLSIRHMAEQIVQGVSDYKIDNTLVNIVTEEKPLGTIGSIKLVKQFFNDTVLLMNSDLLTNIDFKDFYKKFIDLKCDMLVATVPFHVDVPYAVLNINEMEHLVSFSEKPRYTYYSNAGIYIFRKELIELIPENITFDATDFMEVLIMKKKTIGTYPILGYWLDIGRIDDYYKAQEDVKNLKF